MEYKRTKNILKKGNSYMVVGGHLKDRRILDINTETITIASGQWQYNFFLLTAKHTRESRVYTYLYFYTESQYIPNRNLADLFLKQFFLTF